MMHGRGKSDEAIVAVKPANKAERSAAELVERRAEAKGNARHQSMLRTLCRVQHVTRDGRMRIIVYLICVRTRGRSRMRESLMYGSVRGARGNSRPYRDGSVTSADGSFSSDRPASDALGMSASLRSRPNLRTAAIRRKVQQPDSCTAANNAPSCDDLLDHLVGEQLYRVGHLDAERPGRLQVDDELEFGRLQHRQVGGLCAFEDLTGVGADLAKHVQSIGPIAHQP